MKYKAIVLVLGLYCVLPVKAQESAINYFNQLTYSITEFGMKLEKCTAIRSENKILVEEIVKLKNMSEEALQALPYLNQAATNRCTQPERGQLAALILNIDSLKLEQSNADYAELYNTMNAIKEVEFDISRSNPSEDFFTLTQQEQKLLLEINSLQKPFDVLDVFKRASN